MIAGSNSYDGTTIVMPVGAPSIARGFNGNTRVGAPNTHAGIDVVATVGAVVLAVAPGEVTAVAGDLLSGKRIVIDHGKDRSGSIYSTRYFHLDSQLVKIGDQVKRGQIIGRVGDTGLLAPYPHLHFELHRGYGFGHAVNPHEYWLDGPGIVTCFMPYTSVQTSQFRMIYPVKCLQ
ncbi:MAG: M23 family metallopeptidase [Gammaproteobacteria bacterium]|nr:M23 family metallopeptidase [Gammaproteobacteria bacterium]